MISCDSLSADKLDSGTQAHEGGSTVSLARERERERIARLLTESGCEANQVCEAREERKGKSEREMG